MKPLTNNIETKLHSGILLSFKYLKGDILINDRRWDFIFDFYSQSEGFYFIGNRLQFEYPELERDVGYLAEELMVSEHDNLEILLKIKPGNLLINRNLLEKFWSYYEYPAIVFIRDQVSEESLKNVLKERKGYDDFVRLNSGVSIIYRSFELDVLWVAQDPDHPLMKP